MIQRRRLLGAAAFGLGPWGWTARLHAEGTSGAGVPAPSGVPDPRIDRVLESARTGGRRLPGMVGGYFGVEGPVSIGASGIRKIGSPRPIRPDDVVHLGSCTKAMTATMIGTLVDEGKLGWEVTLGEALPDRRGPIHPDFRGVTLAQLLAHRAGLPRDVDWWGLGAGLSVAEQRRRLPAILLQGPPEYPPGSRFAYSNAGYVLAGLIAERAGGASWEDLMRRRLFEPLGMASAGFGPPARRGRDDQPWGHRAVGDGLRPEDGDNPPVMGPAGTVHASVADWARFARLHLSGAVDGARPLRAETLRALHTPAPGGDYAGGWSVVERSWAGGRALTHSGSNGLWYATIWLAPARGLGLIVAANAGGDPASAACDEAIGGLLRLARPDGGDR